MGESESTSDSDIDDFTKHCFDDEEAVSEIDDICDQACKNQPSERKLHLVK